MAFVLEPNTQEELAPVMDCDEKILEISLAVQFFSSSFGSTGFLSISRELMWGVVDLHRSI